MQLEPKTLDSWPHRRLVMNIGAELKAARQRRGLTLDQLSARTKIQRRLLHALERDELAALPGGVFTRGFVRAYACEVGLDPDVTTRRFLARDEQRLAVAAPGEAPIKDGDQAQREPDRSSAPDPRAPRVRDFVPDSPWFTTALLVLGAVLYFAWAGWPPSRHASADRTVVEHGAAATTGSVDARAMRPVDRETTETAGTPTRTPLHISIESRGLCWVAATADGTRVLYRLLQPGERHTIEGRNDVILRVGDPGTFDFAINGTSGRPLGRPGEPVTIRVTTANYRDYVK